jgi:hypothetical protein
MSSGLNWVRLEGTEIAVPDIQLTPEWWEGASNGICWNGHQVRAVWSPTLQKLVIAHVVGLNVTQRREMTITELNTAGDPEWDC